MILAKNDDFYQAEERKPYNWCVVLMKPRMLLGSLYKLFKLLKFLFKDAISTLKKDAEVRRCSSGVHVSDENKSMWRYNRAPSLTASCNTLAVPSGIVNVAEDGLILGSFGNQSFGSTVSLGAASATSEYIKDGGDAVNSPFGYCGPSSSFSFSSIASANSSVNRCKDIAWLKASKYFYIAFFFV